MYTMSATLSTTTIELHPRTVMNNSPHTATNKSRPTLLSYDTICRPSKIGQAFSNKVKLIFNWLIFSKCLYNKFLLNFSVVDENTNDITCQFDK